MMSPPEAEQLGKLLLSNQEENIQLALTLLEGKAEQVEAVKAQILVYYFFSYLSPTERAGHIVYNGWQPFYFMTKEGREIEPRVLLGEWLLELLPNFEEEEHCLFLLKHKNLAVLQIQGTPTPALPFITRLQQDLVDLDKYTSYIDTHAEWATYYYRYGSYLRYLLDQEEAKALDAATLWDYQKVVLEYFIKAQQQAPDDKKIARDIGYLLHKRSPATIVAKEYAQVVIDSYLIAAYVADPTAPFNEYVASYSYIELANFYRDVLQQALSAHYYYEKSLTLAPSNDQAKIEWATLLEQEGATQRAAELLATVDPAYEPLRIFRLFLYQNAFYTALFLTRQHIPQFGQRNF